jgi:hypothetical protein
MVTYALDYAERGFKVLRLYTLNGNMCSCGDVHCGSPGKHPQTRHGLKDATTDRLVIERWWRECPDANIGILTGAESGIIVVDVDDKDGMLGSESLQSLAARFGGLPRTLTSITGNGRHPYYEHPGIPIKNSVGTLAPGVDVRAENGYVVAPPSRHANGSRYRWEDPDQPLAPLPDWLLAMMTPNKEELQMQKLLSPPSKDSMILKGSRNDTLHKLGSGLRGKHGMEQTEIASILTEYNLTRCFPPMDESEVISIVDSVCQYPPGKCTEKSLERQEQSRLYWFPLNTRDWLSDVGLMLMTDTQLGWRCQLMVLAFANGGFLPADIDQLSKLAKAKNKATFEKACAPVLAEYEEVIRGGVRMLKHTKLAAQYMKALDTWMDKKNAGGARQRQRRSALLEQGVDGDSEIF